MENYKDYIEKRVEIFPQQFKFGSFIRYEHCLEACKMAVEEASKNFIKPDVIKSGCPHCNHVNVGTFENLNHCFVCEHEWQTVL